MRAGHAAFLLIHEVQQRRGHNVSVMPVYWPHSLTQFATHVQATFDDDKAAMAVRKKHSTVGEALQVAHRMQAQHVVLTHFSQRCVFGLPRGHISFDNGAPSGNT